MCGYADMKRRERENVKKREEEEVNERESLAHFLFSSLMLTFNSEPCKLLSLDAVMTCKDGSVCVRESVENVSIGEREREERRE